MTTRKKKVRGKVRERKESEGGETSAVTLRVWIETYIPIRRGDHCVRLCLTFSISKLSDGAAVSEIPLAEEEEDNKGRGLHPVS